MQKLFSHDLNRTQSEPLLLEGCSFSLNVQVENFLYRVKIVDKFVFPVKNSANYKTHQFQYGHLIEGWTLIKSKMEMKYLKCLVMISLCLNGALEGKKSKSLRARLTALENLLNTQVYLIRDTIQSEIAQRETLAQKLEETIEPMERLQNELLLARTHKSDEVGPKYLKTEAKNLKKAITGDIVNEISEMLVRHRRGLREEKIARKKDKEGIMSTLEAIMNTFQQVPKEISTGISEMKAGIIRELKAEIIERTDRLHQTKRLMDLRICKRICDNQQML